MARLPQLIGRNRALEVLLGSEDIAVIRERYDTEYARLFDRPVPGSDIEIMSYAVVVTTVTQDIEPATRDETLFEEEPAASRTQLVRDTTTGAVAEWAIHDRSTLKAWAIIRGPAIIAEDETSTLVGPGWTATVNGLGYLELTRA